MSPPLAGALPVGSSIHGPPAMVRASGSLPNYPVGEPLVSQLLSVKACSAGAGLCCNCSLPVLSSNPGEGSFARLQPKHEHLVSSPDPRHLL